MKKTAVDTIGTSEHVDLPSHDLFGVPAKIDTGADSSAIWASDIKVDDSGVLECQLFAAGSRFFSGKVLRFDDYRTQNVKNSFGDSEIRYKVRLPLCIGRRRIGAWVTLSDRSTMKYPILLGRRLLRNRFIVDVSRADVHASPEARKRRVLVLAKVTDKTKEFMQVVQRHITEPCEILVRGYDDLLFEISSDAVHVTDAVSGIGIAEFDLVYFKSHQEQYASAMAVVEYLRYYHVGMIDEELEQHVMYDKLGEHIRLALHGLPVAKSYCASTPLLLERLESICNTFGFPLVCKEIGADRGRKNYLLRSVEEVREILSNAEAMDKYLLQEYIPNEGYIRALVLYPEVPVVISRKDVPHINPLKNHLNNPKGNSNATLLEAEQVPSQITDLGVRAAVCMKRQVAGVDLIKDTRTDRWVVLEVNSSPMLSSGSFPEEKAAAFAKFVGYHLKR